MSTLATHVVDISDGTVYDIPAFIAALAGSPGADGSDGADGADGNDGLSLLSGSSDPTTEGVNGDFYINTTSTTLFGPKAAGTWPSGVSLIGPTGATGAGSGDALVADPLSQFAATTSAQLAGVISDETGSGALVFANSPVFVTPALGTPVSGNLANCTFPTLNQNTTGNADTATYATVAGSSALASYATAAGSAATLTTPRNINGVAFNGSANITIIPRIASAASTATLTVDADTTDEAILTAQAAALAIAAPTGTPVQGQRLVYRIKDNGTARAFTWNAIFRAFNVVLPPTTKVSTTLIAIAIYNATDTKWDVVYAEFEGVKARGSESLTGSTPTPNWGAYQQSNITASSGITVGAPTGTLTDGMRRVLRIEDNASSQTLAFNAVFRAIGFTLPTATVTGKVMYFALLYHETDTKWDILSYRYEL